MTDEAFVEVLYETVLGRPSDRGGREAILADLARGADPKKILKRFVDSAEYAARMRSAGNCTGASTAFARRHRAPVLDLLAHLAPHDVVGCGKIRVGRDNDGGYVMLDDFAGLAVAYSLGIADDASWDKQIAGVGLDVFQYDHTIVRPPEADTRFHWRQCRVEAVPSGDPSSVTLVEALRENGHAAGSDCLLKIDVEGAEWEIFAAIAPDLLRVFRQIVCELHGLGGAVDPTRCALMRKALINLTAYHRVVHVHGNNHAPWALIGGVAVPDVLEITLARIDDRTFVPAAGTFPSPLDQPNHPEHADFQLGCFRFGES